MQSAWECILDIILKFVYIHNYVCQNLFINLRYLGASLFVFVPTLLWGLFSFFSVLFLETYGNYLFCKLYVTCTFISIQREMTLTVKINVYS